MERQKMPMKWVYNEQLISEYNSGICKGQKGY